MARAIETHGETLVYAAGVVADDLELIAQHNQERYADLAGSLLGYAAILRRALADAEPLATGGYIDAADLPTIEHPAPFVIPRRWVEDD